MSIKVMSYVWEHCRQKGSKKLMMLAIADHADDYGVAFPGVPRLATKCEMTERNAQSILSTLESEGEIAIDFKNGISTSHGNTNRYHLIQYRRSIGITSEEIITSRGEVDFTSRGEEIITPGVNGASPKPSVEPSDKPSISVAPNGSTPRKPQSKAERHPELSLEELEAAKRKAIEESTAQTNREIARQKNFAALEKAVKVLPGVSGKLATQYAHMFNGTATKGEYWEYRIEGGITAVEFETWHTYYLKHQQAVNDSAMVTSPKKLHGYVNEWIDAGKPAAPTSNGKNPLAGFKEYTGKDSS